MKESADKFALSVFSLAVALKNLLESNYNREVVQSIVVEFIKLKNKVQLHTNILEQKQTAEKFQQQQRSLA